MEKFSEFWCFRLGAIMRKISREYNARYQQYGITIGQSFVLFDLLDYDGSSVKDIASRIQLDSPAVTGLIDRLSREDLVHRVEDHTNRRSVKISLTPKGRSLAEEILPIAHEYNQHIKDTIESFDVPVFERSLISLQNNL